MFLSPTKHATTLLDTVDIPETVLADYVEAFKTFDTDGTGQIEPHELNRALIKCGIKKTPKEITEIIKEVDYNGNGEINFVEFCTMMNMYSNPTASAEVDAVFDRFAGKHAMRKSSTVSRQDMSLAFRAMNEPISDADINAIFEAAGVSGTQGLTKAQFRELFAECIPGDLVGS